MAKPLHTGWKIVCPDGQERHYPYINFGDAECDSGVLAERGCAPRDAGQSSCPGGEHKVEPVTYQMPAPTGES